MKPHITKTADGYACTGRGYRISSVTASGAYIAWVRYVSLRIICKLEVAA